MSSVKNHRTLGMVILQLALGLFFIVTGLITLQLDSGFFGQIKASFMGNEVASAISHLVSNKSVANILIIVFGIIEFLAGIFLLIHLFVATGTNFTEALMIIIMIVWLIVIIIVDVLGHNGLLGGHVFGNIRSVMTFLKQLSAHLLVLGAVMTVKN